MSDWDNFDDIVHGSMGIYGDDTAALDHGLVRLDSVTTHPTQQGVALEFRCHGCGKTRRLTLDYPEIVALKNQMSPHIAFGPQAPPQLRQVQVTDPTNWTWRGHEGWGLNMRCDKCPYHYSVRMSADEPDKILRSALRLGFIDQRGYQGVNQLVHQYAQHLHQRRQGR
jgi:hypothetical protein